MKRWFNYFKNKNNKAIAGLVVSVGLSLVWGSPANAQVTPDSTLSTTVSRTGNSFTINNGSRVSNHLFHSFSQFSVPTNGAATFNNAADVQTIFSRVTGGRVSNIDGLLQTNGNADLFLLNPSGILFGPNASLNVGGSFIASTADSVVFEDGAQFSAADLTASPLLTVSIPVGLQLGTRSGEILVQETGHRLSGGRGSIPTDRSNNPAGLQVSAGNTLSLIGNGVTFAGGVVGINGGGHLEVGSLSQGQVRLNAAGEGWVGDYSSVSQFSDIQLTQQSLLDASGSQGSIQLQGRNISFTDGSSALIQNLGTQPSDGMTVNAAGVLRLTGGSSNGVVSSSLQIENLGTGQIGNINISAEQLLLQQGGQILSQTFSPGSGGSIDVKVSGDIAIESFIPANPGRLSTIGAVTYGPLSNSGSITIASENLRVLDGGAIGSATSSSGQASAVQINTTGLTEIAGFNPFTLIPSVVSSTSLGDGNANDLTINTSRLVIRDGAALGSTALSAGAAGSVIVNASEAVEVRGRGPTTNQLSRILSAAEIVDPITQALLRVPPIPSGNSGSITIQTPSLTVSDQGTVSVRNDGPGTSGSLQINAGSIFLNNQGSITANAQSGEGGNIALQGDVLVLRQNSVINATAGGTGNGGNITIDVPIVVGIENSDIIANAVEGIGGNIDITTQGIFGLEFREQLTPDNDITASSQFGVSGTVQINTINVDPNSGLVELPNAVADPSQQIATGCEETQGSQFVATGRGGVPQNPTQQVNRDRTWEDVRDLSAYRQSDSAELPALTVTPNLVETTSWRRNASGQIELIAEQSAVPQSVFATCSG